MASSASNSGNLLQFFALIGQLKHLKRTGWVRSGVKDPETVAGHMYRMAVMSMVAARQPDCNVDRCVKLALVHDMAESIVGDITPSCGISKEDKRTKERAAMKEIKSMVGESVGNELYKCWEEYENQTTPESRLIKDLDRFDMVLQAFEYEQRSERHNLQEFFDSTAGSFQNETVKEWMKELNNRRRAFHNRDSQGKISSKENVE